MAANNGMARARYAEGPYEASQTWGYDTSRELIPEAKEALPENKMALLCLLQDIRGTCCPKCTGSYGYCWLQRPLKGS